MYWSFWLGALALVAIAVGHWLLVGRMMAVSGRFTTLVNRLRFGEQNEAALSDEDLMAAIQAATLAEFGEDGLDARPPARAGEHGLDARSPAPASAKRPPQPLLAHVLFLSSLVLGGLLASLGAHEWQVSGALRSELFPRFFGSSPATSAAVLLLGGVLVGFGTRMAAGCTSGHGLCGVSRFQKGSLVATAAFFGAGIAASVLLQGVL